MIILLTGATGLIGSHIAEILTNNDITVLTPSSAEFNIASKQSVHNYVNSHKPDIVVHCAAHTDVTGGEQQRDDKQGPAWMLNVEGTNNIVNASKTNNTKIIHISTDMVFSGKKDDPGPYTEDHEIETDSERLSWYGWSKAQAERILKISNTDYAIVRISNPTRSRYVKKLDYVHKIVAAYDAGKPIKLFNDQHLTLTYVNEVSQAVATIIQKNMTGIFHVSSSNIFTPYDLAIYTLAKARKVNNVVQPSSLEEFLNQPGNSSRYLQFGGLDVKETEKKLDLKFRTWEQIIDELITEGL